jgi:hypothetical protein
MNMEMVNYINGGSYLFIEKCLSRIPKNRGQDSSNWILLNVT